LFDVSGVGRSWTSPDVRLIALRGRAPDERSGLGRQDAWPPGRSDARPGDIEPGDIGLGGTGLAAAGFGDTGRGYSAGAAKPFFRRSGALVPRTAPVASIPARIAARVQPLCRVLDAAGKGPLAARRSRSRVDYKNTMPLRFALRLFKHGSLWVYRLLTFAVLAGGLMFAFSVLLLRYWVLPNIDEYREAIVGGLTRATKQRIQVGRIEGEWDGYRPRLILREVTLLDASGQERLKLEEVDSTLAWLSLFSGQLRFHSIELEQLSLEIRRDGAGDLLVAGIPLSRSDGEGALGDWLLQQHRVVVRDSQLTWIDERLGGAPLVLTDVDVLVEQLFWHHRFGLRAKPPIEVAAPIDIRGDLRGRSFGDAAGWSGRVYLKIDYANLAALRQWVELPMRTTQGSGSLEIWGSVLRGEAHEMTADVALSDVRTRMDEALPDLQLATLHGRLGWRSSPAARELWASDLSFATPDGVRLPPAAVSYRRSLPAPGRPAVTEIAFDALELEALVRIIDRLPADPALRRRLAELNPRGKLEDFHLRWEDQFSWSGRYAVRGGFRDVALDPSGPVPGLSNLTGSVNADERGGAATLHAADTALQMPLVFAGPLAMDQLDGKGSWTMNAGLPRVVLERVSLTNRDLAGEISGRYDAETDGPGSIDMKGNFTRASGPEAWRYVPLVVGEPVRVWLRRSLISAHARGVRFSLRGDLRRFPWGRSGDGLFEVVADVDDGTVAYAPGWPRLEGVSGQLTVRGSRLEIIGSAGGVFQTKLSGVTAVVPDLGSPDPMLEVRGQADGPTSDFLRYVQESPLQERVAGFTDGMRAGGQGRLSLRIDMPLHHRADAKLSGLYAFADNRLDPGDGLPVLEQFSGRLVFTQDDVVLREGAARVFGAPARFTVMREGNSARVQASGQMDAALLRREVSQFLGAYWSGSTEWRLNATIREHRSDFVFESSLVGLASSLPPPFAKSGPARAPLRIERRERTRTQDLLSVAYADAGSAQLLIDKTAKARVSRGEIVLGGTAPPPQRDGLWLTGKVDRIDIDQWHGLLSRSGAGSGSAGGALAGVSLSAPVVRAFSREFHDVQLGATRRDGAWVATLDSRQVSGEARWLPEGDGLIVGRFARLVLPAATAELVPQPDPGSGRAGEGKELPSVDLTADDFRMGTRQFGKLVLNAVPNGADWRIERLELSNPDGTLRVTGLWQAWAVNPRTQIDLALEVNDIGRYFARMDLPQGVQGGKAKLEGPLSWAGPPYALDLATLSGQLALSANKGRFVKIDPGIGKLLSVVSLQTLPKVVTLDFRDIFSEGFAFDRIAARVDIARGVAHTPDFTMQGPAARVEMTGDVNLVAETQHLDVKIHPALSESVALGTALVNPAVGLGALVLQKAFKDPLGQMLSFEYGVAGTWTAPTVTKKKREHIQPAPAGRK
jgi:uncharacterized protein (TIGR02099 family)